MTLNALNQNNTKTSFELNSYMTSMLGFKFGNNANSNSYFSKKGEPTYQADMDTDSDGIVSFEDFRSYCKNNNISSKQMAALLKSRMTYQLTQSTLSSEKEEDKEKTGSLDLIYAEDGEGKFDENMDFNNDSKISYIEYLRYCEQNAKTEEKRSDTKITTDEQSLFMTSSFGKVLNSYHKNEGEAPKGKVEGEA